MATTWPYYLGADAFGTLMAFRGVDAVTVGTLTLNSAYTYGSTGAAACLLAFIAPETANLTDIWFKVTAYNGTWGNTDGNLNWSVREGLANSRIPGTSVTGSGTYSTGGATGWHNITGLSVALTAGKLYFIIIADADGGATNYATIATRYGGGNFSTPLAVSECGTTTNGFSTAYSNLSCQGACVVKVGSITFGGQIWDTISTVASSSNERGNRFKPEENCTLIGFGGTGDGITIWCGGHNLKIYADDVNPGGTTLLTYSPPSTSVTGTSPAPTTIILPAASRIDLSADTWYRCIFDPASALTVPRKTTVGGNPDATLLAASLPFGGNYYTTEESGGAWSDTTNSFYNFGPILVPKTATGGLLIPAGMVGGFNIGSHP